MTKLLKQLVQVLDERGIQVETLEIDENNFYKKTTIDINKEIAIMERALDYAVYAEETLSKYNYTSLTEALEVVADYLSSIKEGDRVKTPYGFVCTVIKTGDDKYNLLTDKYTLLLSTDLSLKLLNESFKGSKVN